MASWIGVDYGTKRIGLALAHHSARIASPAQSLPGSGNPAVDAPRIQSWASGHDPHGFVVGLPINMDGTDGPQAALSRELARHLQQATHLPVHLWDERLSTFHANDVLRQSGATRAQRKRLRDAIAAQAILQSFLDAGEPLPPPHS